MRILSRTLRLNFSYSPRTISGMTSWKRPESVPYPSIWSTFEGKKEINGMKPKFWIQDATPEYRDEFIHIMKTGFLKDETLCNCSKLTDDEQSVKEFEELWNRVLDGKLALICLTKNLEGQVQLVGGNMCAVHSKDQQDSSLEGKQIKKLSTLMAQITDKKDIYSELGVNEYLSGAGLYVLPEFRGQGVATEILKARRELCLAVGIKACGIMLTWESSQRSAASAGFKGLITVTYEDLAKKNSDCYYPGVSKVSKYAKFMYNKY